MLDDRFNLKLSVILLSVVKGGNVQRLLFLDKCEETRAQLPRTNDETSKEQSGAISAFGSHCRSSADTKVGSSRAHWSF